MEDPNTTSFAVLAPVPKEFVGDGLAVLKKRDYVSFGSQKWDFFKNLDDLRAGFSVPVLIYASYEGEAKPPYLVTWRATYLGSVTSDTDKQHDDEGGHRPAVAEKYREEWDAPWNWAVFWRVSHLEPLASEMCRPIGDLKTYPAGRRRQKAAPRGPELIVRPTWI